MVQSTDFDIFSQFRTKLQKQVPIEGFDFSPLADANATRRDIGARTVLFSNGGPASHLYVVSRGWLIGHTTSRRGHRFVHRIYQPGDLIGVQDINWTYATSTVQSITPASLGEIHKARYMGLFANTTRLGAALHAVGMLDQVIATDTARANLHLEGPDRIAHLLLTIEARQSLTTGRAAGEPFDAPLTQSLIADAVGLSLVHTNKSLRRLQDEGFIHHADKRCRIDRRPELLARTGFQDRYGVTHHEWIERMIG